MSFLTDAKRASGRGSAKSGTEHHWNMMVSSVALVFLCLYFIFSVGTMLGAPHGEVVAYFARPFPAMMALLTVLVGFMHYKNGVQAMIEDYTDGVTRKALIIAMICISYAAAALGALGLIRLAL